MGCCVLNIECRKKSHRKKSHGKKVTDKKSQEKRSQEKKSQEKKSQYVFVKKSHIESQNIILQKRSHACRKSHNFEYIFLEKKVTFM